MDRGRAGAMGPRPGQSLAPPLASGLGESAACDALGLLREATTSEDRGSLPGNGRTRHLAATTSWHDAPTSLLAVWGCVWQSARATNAGLAVRRWPVDPHRPAGHHPSTAKPTSARPGVRTALAARTLNDRPAVRQFLGAGGRVAGRDTGTAVLRCCTHEEGAGPTVQTQPLTWSG